MGISSHDESQRQQEKKEKEYLAGSGSLINNSSTLRLNFKGNIGGIFFKYTAIAVTHCFVSDVLFHTAVVNHLTNETKTVKDLGYF